MRRQRDEVPEEERVRVGHLPDEGLDELIVRVKTARQNHGQEVHSGLATVSVRIGTGPKYRESRLDGTGVATNAMPSGTTPQKLKTGRARPTESVGAIDEIVTPPTSYLPFRRQTRSPGMATT